MSTWDSPEQIEKAAQSAWEELRSRAVNPEFSKPWAEASEGAKARVRDMIRAALAAIRPEVEAAREDAFTAGVRVGVDLGLKTPSPDA